MKRILIIVLFAIINISAVFSQKSFCIGSYVITEKNDSIYQVDYRGSVYLKEIEKNKFSYCDNRLDTIEIIRSFKRYGNQFIIPIACSKNHLDISDRLYLRDSIGGSKLFELICPSISGMNLFILLSDDGSFKWEASSSGYVRMSSGNYSVKNDSLVIFNSVKASTFLMSKIFKEEKDFPLSVIELNFKNRIYLLREDRLYNINPSTFVQVINNIDKN